MKLKKFNLITLLIFVCVLCTNLVFAKSDNSVIFLDPENREIEVSIDELNNGITVFFNPETEKNDFLPSLPINNEIPLRRAIGRMHLGLRYNKNTENGYLYWDVSFPQITGVKANIFCTSTNLLNRKTFYSDRIEKFGYNGLYDRIVGSTDYFYIPYSENKVIVSFSNAYVYSVTDTVSVPSSSLIVSLNK